MPEKKQWPYVIRSHSRRVTLIAAVKARGDPALSRLMKQQPSRPCARTPRLSPPSLDHRRKNPRIAQDTTAIRKRKNEAAIRNLVDKSSELCRNFTRDDEEAGVVGSRYLGAGLPRGHQLSFRSRLDHGELLAGLVRNHSAAPRVDHGFDRRACHRRAPRGCRRYLRKRNRVPCRKTVNQTVHRIHRCNSIGRAWVFWHRRCWRNDAALSQSRFFHGSVSFRFRSG